MDGIYLDSGVVTVGLEEQVKKFERLSTTDPELARLLRDEIRDKLRAARGRLAASAASGLAMKSDPRHASRAVLFTVYKKIFGGNLNILTKRRAGNPREVGSVNRLGRIGGNRRGRNDRTKAIQGYAGSDRGFILRFLNGGTQTRYIKFKSDSHRPSIRKGLRGGDADKYGRTVNTGLRGRITPRPWFDRASVAEMEKVADEIASYVDNVISKIMA